MEGWGEGWEREKDREGGERAPVLLLLRSITSKIFLTNKEFPKKEKFRT
jgi:hypothetical protein